MDYKNAKIYKLVSFQTDKVYVGSTTQSLSKRKAKHKCDYKRWLDGKKHYITSFELIKYDDNDIILLEEYPCENKMELHKREREWIERVECVNKIIPTRTVKQYYEDNKEHINKINKQYQKDHIDELKQYRKQYWQDHRDELKIKKKQYNENHKEELKEKRKIKYTCECGKIICKSVKKRHEKTKRHQKFLLKK